VRAPAHGSDGSYQHQRRGHARSIDDISVMFTEISVIGVAQSARAARVAGLQMFIDPEACTCCGACATECPVSAIYEEDDLPPEWQRYRELAEDFFRAPR
jgi:NAD-dependent dihydropyrimidine dehydrogenase PreA subunit